MKSKFSNWLERQYIEWQIQAGHRKTISEFAEWLGFRQSIVSLWMNGDRTPGHDSADRLALRLGSQVYDLLGLTPSDLRRVHIDEVLKYLTDDQINNIVNQVDRYLRENSQDYDTSSKNDLK